MNAGYLQVRRHKRKMRKNFGKIGSRFSNSWSRYKYIEQCFVVSLIWFFRDIHILVGKYSNGTQISANLKDWAQKKSWIFSSLVRNQLPRYRISFKDCLFSSLFLNLWGLNSEPWLTPLSIFLSLPPSFRKSINYFYVRYLFEFTNQIFSSMEIRIDDVAVTKSATPDLEVKILKVVRNKNNQSNLEKITTMDKSWNLSSPSTLRLLFVYTISKLIPAKEISNSLTSLKLHPRRKCHA